MRLRRVGFDVVGESSVPDSIPLIKAALLRGLAAADAVIVCGGLGPTFDDLTREAVAAALGRSLRFDPRLWFRILKRFTRYRVPVPEENKRQAEVIAGAEVLNNAAGSAPGLRLEFRGRDGRPRSLLLLPGPYSEMAPIFEKALPRLAARHARGLGVASFTLRLVGVPESVADEKLDAVRARFPDAGFTILASGGEVSFHTTVLSHSTASAKKTLASLRREVINAVGRWSYGEGDATLESLLGERLKKRKLTLAVAESCTGGLLGGRITAVSGSSAWFVGGIIAYANVVKTRGLGVSAAVIKRHGAVSAECAAAMALGARKNTGSDIAVAVTGIAGPNGGTKDKPVGLVFVAVSGARENVQTRRYEFHGPRETVRQRAVTAALSLLREVLA